MRYCHTECDICILIKTGLQPVHYCLSKAQHALKPCAHLLLRKAKLYRYNAVCEIRGRRVLLLRMQVCTVYCIHIVCVNIWHRSHVLHPPCLHSALLVHVMNAFCPVLCNTCTKSGLFHVLTMDEVVHEWKRMESSRNFSGLKNLPVSKRGPKEGKWEENGIIHCPATVEL